LRPPFADAVAAQAHAAMQCDLPQRGQLRATMLIVVKGKLCNSRFNEFKRLLRMSS
jgi:hypothetical protein